jgi:transcriptional regulator with XRE-family HTH domain
MENLLLKIKQIRVYKGISRDFIGRSLGIKKDTYGLIENGHIKLTVDKLEIICSLLEVSIYELIETTNNEGSKRNSDVKKMESELMALEVEIEKTRKEARRLIKQIEHKNKIIKRLIDDGD